MLLLQSAKIRSFGKTIYSIKNIWLIFVLFIFLILGDLQIYTIRFINICSSKI